MHLKYLVVFSLLVSFALSFPSISPFPCTGLPLPPPSNDVTKLQPGNIKAVLALGDSISAGFAMKGVWPLGDFLEYRGLVFSIGSDKYVDWPADQEIANTIPNCLLNYNPGLQGSATGVTESLTKGAYLDGAVSGAKIQDVPAQIEYLVNTLKTQYSNTIDFENDWKLVTLFIGANNLCEICTGRYDPNWFEQQLVSVVNQVKQSIPKVFMNIVGIFNISGVYVAGMQSEYCRLLWDTGVDECSCMLAHGDSGRASMDAGSYAYNLASAKVAAQFSSQVTGNKTFTAVYQPGVSGYNISYFGENYLSALDCFHPNTNANSAFTYSIWNNMFTPVGKKQTSVDPNNLNWICPTANQYLQ
eukprot:TRINITY_DN10487_c0_g1_i1.p1 TRINITY_DN10487_c0_g1~~TRINITY_DN10487_c0_g1_i1.p1  ORF type:complete len:358 (+),score=63.39 TRINITY_DN10487_c0_g1_i1:42-1115(+)